MKINITSNPCSTQNYKTGGWRTYIPSTDYDGCIGCGTCSRVCPENCVTMQKVKANTRPKTDFDYCKGCGVCAAECPVKCIKMSLETK